MQIVLEIDGNEEQLRMLKEYMNLMPINVILNGLNFTYKRWVMKQEGILMVGRKSKIKKEVSIITKEQAKWRLKNWKLMIKNYREKGYSYPTISRIKKALIMISNG